MLVRIISFDRQGTLWARMSATTDIVSGADESWVCVGIEQVCNDVRSWLVAVSDQRAAGHSPQ